MLAMPGASYRKPDDEKVTRHPPKFDWIDLAPVPNVAVPALPDWRAWTEATLAWWAQLWAKPQAAMWTSDGSTLFTLAVLHHELVTGDGAPSPISAEMRQIEDRHGLNPKAMMQLRWRVVEAPAAGSKPAAKKAAAKKAASRKDRVLKLVDGVPAS